jgi:hypothetical protein
MNSKSFLALLVTVVFLVALSLNAFAQDATGTPSGTGNNGEATEAAGGTGDTDALAMANCDSDLILSLYIAERFFGFSSFNRQMAPGMVIDTNSFNHGQYTALFDDLDPSTSVINISDESRTNMSDLLGLNDTDFDGQINTTMSSSGDTTLSAGTFADDEPECAALRLSLRRFYTTIAMSDSQMGGFNSNPANTGTEGTGAGNTGTEGTSGTGTNNNQSGTGTNNNQSGTDANNNQAGTDTNNNQSGSDTSNNQAGTNTNSNQSGTGTANNQTATGTGASNAQAGVITINLAGTSEFPGPGDEDVTGIATIYLRPNRNMVCVDIIVNDVTVPVTAATIYRGAAGTAGTPVVSLNVPGAAGISNTCVTVDPALMQEMLNNPENFYISISSAEFPNGAARGQLR